MLGAYILLLFNLQFFFTRQRAAGVYQIFQVFLQLYKINLPFIIIIWTFISWFIRHTSIYFVLVCFLYLNFNWKLFCWLIFLLPQPDKKYQFLVSIFKIFFCKVFRWPEFIRPVIIRDTAQTIPTMQPIKNTYKPGVQLAFLIFSLYKEGFFGWVSLIKISDYTIVYPLYNLEVFLLKSKLYFSYFREKKVLD